MNYCSLVDRAGYLSLVLITLRRRHGSWHDAGSVIFFVKTPDDSFFLSVSTEMT